MNTELKKTGKEPEDAKKPVFNVLPVDDTGTDASEGRSELNGHVQLPEKEAASIDRQSLAAIRVLEKDGRTGILTRIISLYLKSSPALIASLRQGIETQDAVKLHQAAHSLKSSSAMLGARRLAELCLQMERKGKENCLGNAGSLLVRIESEYGVAQAALRLEIDDGPA